MTGTLKRLHAQSKVLEYLCNLSTYVCAQPVSGARTERSREIVRDLHDFLIRQEGKLPTLDELAVRYGLSARWLNDEFAREYGMPIYSFITDHRLAEAHTALLDGNLPIKKISQRLGYSHVNHFTNGFKKKFGYTPGSLRRGRRV
jgi:AraC-like DNA-binding protein